MVVSRIRTHQQFLLCGAHYQGQLMPHLFAPMTGHYAPHDRMAFDAAVKRLLDLSQRVIMAQKAPLNG